MWLKPDKEPLNIIYQEDCLTFGELEGTYYLVTDEGTCRLSDLIREPGLYIELTGAKMITMHNAFTVKDMCDAARENKTITLVSGNDYNIEGLIKLIRKAIVLAMDNVDASYVEGQCFMDFMKEKGADSPETAVSLEDAGLKSSMLYPLIHSRKIKETSEGKYYLRDPEKEPDERFGRVISNNVRFGYGYRPFEGRRQYYAWHGYPNRNDDYFTTVEITEKEFRQIEMEYPGEISADRATAEIFRDKYVEGHPVIYEGWNRTI